MVGKLWWPTVQRDYFSVDIRRPKNGILVEKSSQLWRLDAFQDDDGLLRMRDRASRPGDACKQPHAKLELKIGERDQLLGKSQPLVDGDPSSSGRAFMQSGMYLFGPADNAVRYLMIDRLPLPTFTHLMEGNRCNKRVARNDSEVVEEQNTGFFFPSEFQLAFHSIWKPPRGSWERLIRPVKAALYSSLTGAVSEEVWMAVYKEAEALKIPSPE
ncbi:unnamed protein product [Allacma fusca]|uniref:Uncharacterized protein n=1 Tax=Allacma fusca TaxID=39272 RepID=A0A8J2L5Z2_9HEXA|nr:unnamed protein product [Allacma fusca]